MRNFYPIVGVPIGNVNDVGHDPPTRGRIAFQFVGHQLTGTTTLPSHKLIEESYRGFGITPRLDEYVDNIPVLVNGAIEIMLVPTNAHEDLVHMPGIPIPTIPPTQSGCISRTEFRTPPPDRLI